MLRGVWNPELVGLGDTWVFSSNGSSGSSLYEAGADRGRFGLLLPLEFPEDRPGGEGEGPESLSLESRFFHSAQGNLFLPRVGIV